MMLADRIAIVFFIVLGIFYLFYFCVVTPTISNKVHVFGFLGDDIYVIDNTRT